MRTNIQKPHLFGAGFSPFLQAPASGNRVSWVDAAIAASKYHREVRMVRAQYLRQEFADRNPLGHEYALQLMQSKTCPACFKQHLQGGGMIAFPGALYKEIASGSVCVPVAFLDDGRIDMEPVSVEAFLPQEVVVAVKSDKTTLW